MDFTTDAINIKTYPLSEFDNIILMYSRQKGLIRGVAPGVKRPKSKLGARMQILVANKLLLNKGKNLDKITQAQALNTFSKLRKDLDKLTYSMYLAELIGSFCKESEQNSEEIYDIFYNSLEKIANSNEKKEILFNVLKFQLNLMEILGYGLHFKDCSICGCSIAENPMFSIENGACYCKKCSLGRKIPLVNIPIKIAEFLDEIAHTNVASKTKYDDLINLKIVETCFNLLKKYTSHLLPKELKVTRTIGELNDCKNML